MAANCSDQKKSCHLAINHGSSGSPINSSCFQMLKPSFDEVNQEYSVDVFPVFVEEAPVPMRLNFPCSKSQHEPNIYSISLLPEEEDDVDVQCSTDLTVLSLLEVQDPCKDQMFSHGQLDCEECIDFQMESMDAYAAPCVVDIDIEQGSFLMPKQNNEDVGSINGDGLLANMHRVLRRQVSVKTGEKLMQLLMDNSTMLLKLATKEKSAAEWAHHDITNNRWRRCKRAASFDSRKIVIFFSIMSSMGTLILIYLTLKVRQNSDRFVHNW